MAMENAVIHLGTDHAGFRLKEAVKRHLEAAGRAVIDHGTHDESPSDYPDFVIPAVEAAMMEGGAAIVFGGSGNGECMAANKVAGARAALVYDEQTAILSREHNDANVLGLGGRTVTSDEALTLRLVDLWLTTSFSGDERHARRIGKITAFEHRHQA